MFRGPAKSAKSTRISVATVNASFECQEKTQPSSHAQENYEFKNIRINQSSHEQKGSQGALRQIDERVKALELAPRKPQTRSRDYCLLLALVIVLLFLCVASFIFTLYLHISCGCRDSSTAKGKITSDIAVGAI